MKTEDWFKGEQMKALRLEMPGGVFLRHEDQFTSGIPDISSTFARSTIWAEAKAICPTPGREFRTTHIQLLTALRLDEVGSWCRFLVWLEDDFGTVTYLLRPRELIKPIVNEGRTKLSVKRVRALNGQVLMQGHDFAGTAAYLRYVHEVLKQGGVPT
jgi:hypothetical protein